MTLSFKHLFQSSKSNAADASIVRPTNWNAEHDVELTGPALVGRTAASQGAAAEIVISGALGIVSDTLKIFVPGYTNAEITESHAVSAATFALKTTAGVDATATDPITAFFGTGVTFSQTAGLSVTIPSTAMMGARNGIPFRLWFCLISDGGTGHLGVRNCVTTVAGSGTGSAVTAVSGFSDHGTLSSTTIGTGSDSAGVTYTDTGVTTQPFVVLGYADYDSGLATAGTWAVSPDRIVMFGSGIPLPGNIMQVQRVDTGAVATGQTILPFDDTIPQISEGTQFMSQAITPNSVQNILRVTTQSQLATDTVALRVSSALFDGSNNALATIAMYLAPADRPTIITMGYNRLSAVTSAVTFTVRSGPPSAATVTFNGDGGARSGGGVSNSFLQVEELMG